jgi:hypothetical protein
MKTNIGNLDKILRVFIVVVNTILFLTHTISGTLDILLLIIAGILTLTSFIGLCPLYAYLKLEPVIQIDFNRIAFKKKSFFSFLH